MIDHKDLLNNDNKLSAAFVMVSSGTVCEVCFLKIQLKHF